ncbi:PA1136 family autoinducer-binding transcriptional regulator [Paracoccus zhejiangensis]|uniref:LuxR family transcriptional regulator n=1 Tax=Paracoccus zhejiangensis TaxID=1077935 RepID=A0A2H5EVN7_9RHOB|nr:PA1136 family autoinducer-binding transcriptional regulator [Paracoccus zhejiangensis]AUH63340.1 LuxR family transcriptional regulator [Paracoccus zhejiangensis]
MDKALPDGAFRTALAIGQSDSLAALQSRTRSFCAPLGYDRFVLFSASVQRDEILERIYWVEGDWFGSGKPVDADLYVRRCPVTRHMLKADEPFFWTKLTKDGEDSYQVVGQPRGPGIHGLQVPVFGPLGLEGAMSLGGLRIDASPGARMALALVAVAAFRAARRLIVPPVELPSPSLSPREREVLSWIAAGRRQNEIAATLNLSERTVENHLRRIRRRLGVTTTAQAVTMALRQGELAG